MYSWYKNSNSKILQLLFLLAFANGVLFTCVKWFLFVSSYSLERFTFIFMWGLGLKCIFFREDLQSPCKHLEHYQLDATLNSKFASFYFYSGYLVRLSLGRCFLFPISLHWKLRQPNISIHSLWNMHFLH